MGSKKEKVIGKYPIVKTLKKGGMGIIYLAKHPTLNRMVIIKKLAFKGNREIKERFKREAELMMDLKSEYIVNVYDHFKIGSSHYLVQEYIEGLSLDDIIKRDGKLDSIDSAIISLDIAKALKYIHSKGIIHRDIKPGNILIDIKGHSKLTDFGIASLGKNDEIDSASTLEFLGTPTYMPPEQIDNFQDSDEKGDIYSFGVVLYEMLTGLKPFMGNITPKLIKDIKKGRFYSIRKMNPGAAKQLCQISRKAMRRKRSTRFVDFSEIVQCISKYLKKSREVVKRERVAQLINNSDSSKTSFRAFMDNSIKLREEKRKKLRRKIFNIIIFSLIILFISSITYLGFGYRILKSPNYGSLILSINSGDSPLRSSIEIKDSSGRDINKFYTLSKDSLGNFISSDINLKTGEYYIVTSHSGRKSVNFVNVLPYSISRFNVMHLSMEKDNKNEIKVSYNIKDAITKENINSKVIFIHDELEYGKVNSITFKSNGYYNKKIPVFINSLDREVFIEGELTPVRGRFHFSGETGREYKLKIDNSYFYIDGSPNQIIKKLEPFTESITLNLNPGRYFIEIISHKEVIREWEVTIFSDKITKVSYP